MFLINEINNVIDYWSPYGFIYLVRGWGWIHLKAHIPNKVLNIIHDIAYMRWGRDFCVRIYKMDDLNIVREYKMLYIIIKVKKEYQKKQVISSRNMPSTLLTTPIFRFRFIYLFIYSFIYLFIYLKLYFHRLKIKTTHYRKNEATESTGLQCAGLQ